MSFWNFFRRDDDDDRFEPRSSDSDDQHESRDRYDDGKEIIKSLIRLSLSIKNLGGQVNPQTSYCPDYFLVVVL